jgi:hypothetical protein
MRVKSFLKDHRILTALLIGLTLVVLASILALTLPQQTTASSNLLDNVTLNAKAIAHAQEKGGLRGVPRSQRSAVMRLAEWTKLTGGELGKDAPQFGLSVDTQVYVLAIRGDVEWRGVGIVQPGQTQPERYDNITVVLDASTGELLSMEATRPGFSMPLPVL